MRILSIAPLLLAASPLAPAQVEDVPLLERVVCVGASASGGYGLNLELKTRVKIGLLLDQMLPAGRAPSVDLGSAMLFQAPDELAIIQIEKALEVEPTLVVAADFLFWFAYTTSRVREDGTARAARLERGLALLDRLECPLIVGDLPDMTIALTGKGPLGPLLTPQMIPNLRDLETFNVRIRAWATERGDVTLMPMAAFMKRVTAGETIELRGNRWEGDDARQLFQQDLLHPTAEGAFGLLVLALDRLVADRDDLDPDSVLWDVEAAYQGLLEATKDGRAKTLERERKREERRKAREKAREGDGTGEAEELLPAAVRPTCGRG